MRQIKYLCGCGNKLRFNFFRCSERIKNILFNAHCFPCYACQLWARNQSKVLRRLRVAYNDCFRCLHGIPRFCIARPGQVAVNIDTFDPLIGIFLHAANGPVTDMYFEQWIPAYYFLQYSRNKQP